MICDISLLCDTPGWLVVSLRPYNPEGISFIDSIKLTDDRKSWLVIGRKKVTLNRSADRHHSSHYNDGDVYIHLKDIEDDTGTNCRVGLATAAAMFESSASEYCEVSVKIPLSDNNRTNTRKTSEIGQDTPKQHNWHLALEEQSTLRISNQNYLDLYNAAVTSLVLCSPSEVYAGPFNMRLWNFCLRTVSLATVSSLGY